MRRAPPPDRARARGFSLVELVVAVVILAIATLAALRSFDQAQRGIGQQLARGLAHQVALNRAEELRLNGLSAGRGLPDSVEMGRRNWTVTLDEAATQGALVEVTIRVSAQGTPGSRLVVFVPPEVRR
ncbi:prepilin-type N-terminal cleavage/methylation domain-containing protein [Roseovarius salis]|uniref:prepilin-type N-terminal cleavage/methylation domain-containing protein n=1 Tax=Roseovarius salis TaxID=3376063 RepID=UPI0037C87856